MILILIADILNHYLNLHAQLSSGARGQTFGLSLHILLCHVYVTSESSVETGRIHMLIHTLLGIGTISTTISCTGFILIVFVIMVPYYK